MATETVTYLEMTTVDDLVPATPVSGLELELVERGSAVIRSTLVEAGAPYAWPCLLWPDDYWAEWLAYEPRTQWLLKHDGEIAGIAELEAQPGGVTEVSSFGLLPEYVGRGIGGYALTLALARAWDLPSTDHTPVTRVWLHTSTRDHPRALPNYLKRGLRAFKTEVREGS